MVRRLSRFRMGFRDRCYLHCKIIRIVRSIRSGDTILNCVEEGDVGSETTYFLKGKERGSDFNIEFFGTPKSVRL
jgi:hypothetical protein